MNYCNDYIHHSQQGLLPLFCSTIITRGYRRFISTNMRLLKTHPILGLLNSYMVDSPQPANLSYMWNFGSLLGACLGIQIITGVTLAMHYTPSVDLAFISVEHIASWCVLIL